MARLPLLALAVTAVVTPSTAFVRLGMSPQVAATTRLAQGPAVAGSAYPGYHVAQFNLGTLKAPLDDAVNAEFEASLDAINLLAETSAGFVWRLTSDDGKSSGNVKVTEDPCLIPQMSVWTGLDPLFHFTHRSGHGSYLKRRGGFVQSSLTRGLCMCCFLWCVCEGVRCVGCCTGEWFRKMPPPVYVLWWIPEGTTPTLEEALERLEFLRSNGPSPEAFSFAARYPPPDQT